MKTIKGEDIGKAVGNEYVYVALADGSFAWAVKSWLDLDGKKHTLIDHNVESQKVIMSDKKTIKGEDIGARIGSEWEKHPDYVISDDVICLRRLPEKSDLQLWAESHLNFNFLKNEKEERCPRAEAVTIALQAGFNRAIEVAENVHSQEARQKLGVYGQAAQEVIFALKRFAGVK